MKHIYIYICMYVCMYVYIYIYTCIHVCIYTYLMYVEQPPNCRAESFSWPSRSDRAQVHGLCQQNVAGRVEGGSLRLSAQ